MAKKSAYACGTVFKEFYEEALNANPLYAHLLYTLNYCLWQEREAWRQAVAALHEYEYSSFKIALRKTRDIDHGDVAIYENEFDLFRTVFHDSDFSPAPEAMSA